MWWGAVGDEEAVGGDAWICMKTVHEDVADVFGGAGAVEVPAEVAYAGGRGRLEAAWTELKSVYLYAGHGVF